MKTVTVTIIGFSNFYSRHFGARGLVPVCVFIEKEFKRVLASSELDDVCVRAYYIPTEYVPGSPIVLQVAVPALQRLQYVMMQSTRVLASQLVNWLKEHNIEREVVVQIQTFL